MLFRVIGGNLIRVSRLTAITLIGSSRGIFLMGFISQVFLSRNHRLLSNNGSSVDFQIFRLTFRGHNTNIKIYHSLLRTIVLFRDLMIRILTICRGRRLISMKRLQYRPHYLRKDRYLTKTDNIPSMTTTLSNTVLFMIINSLSTIRCPLNYHSLV